MSRDGIQSYCLNCIGVLEEDVDRILGFALLEGFFQNRLSFHAGALQCLADMVNLSLHAFFLSFIRFSVCFQSMEIGRIVSC